MNTRRLLTIMLFGSIAAGTGCAPNTTEDPAPYEPPRTEVAASETDTVPVAASDTMPASPMDVPEATAEMQAVLDQLAALGPKPIPQLPAAEARRQPTPADAVKALLDSRGESTAPMPVGNVENRSIEGPAGPIPVRIYTPAGTGPFPVIVYYHGGGWVIANLDTYDASARALTNAANAIVVSSHYRQGPEHKFPAAHEDAFAAYRWALENAASLGGDPARVAVVGESAGGNLAAAVSMMARDSSVQMPVHQVLVYPIANYGFDTESYQEYANAKPLSRELMMWFFDKYLGSPEDGASPLISLVDATNLQNLPPATIINAQIDPLQSEGEMYAARLGEAGIDVEQRTFEGVTHEFFGMGAVLPQAREAVAMAGERLKESFGTP